MKMKMGDEKTLEDDEDLPGIIGISLYSRPHNILEMQYQTTRVRLVSIQ